MIKIAICDDERELREVTAARLREYFAEEALIAPFESGETLLRAVREENCCYQLAVLDIELGEMNGIAVGEALNRLLPTCQIIYLTGYLDYAPDAYAPRHTYYVYRPRPKTANWCCRRRAASWYWKNGRSPTWSGGCG